MVLFFSFLLVHCRVRQDVPIIQKERQCLCHHETNEFLKLKHLRSVTKSLPKGGEAVINNESDEYPTLVRATYKDTRISTIVSPEDFNKFQNSYATVIRAYMDNLKKKERNKKAKNSKAQKSKSK
ncbi:unnamed protein product [Cunninghamella echinulata]